MDPIVTSALIGAGTSVAGSGASTIFNVINAKKSREWQEKMINQQNDWNLQQWNRQNEYDAPDAQVSRLRDAGLNPLFYGLDGSGSAGLQSATPLDSATPQMNSNPLGQASSYLAEMALNLKQQKVLESEANKNDAQAESARADAELKTEQSTTERDSRHSKIELMNTQISVMTSQDERENERMMKEFEFRKQELDLKIQEGKLNWERLSLDKKRLALDVSAEEFRQAMAEQQLSLEEQKLQVAIFNAGVAKMATDSQIQVNNANILKINAEGQLTIQRVKLAEKDVEWYDTRMKQEIRNQKIENVTKCIDSGCRAVNTAVVVGSAFATGGLSTVFSGSGDIGYTTSSTASFRNP